MRSLHLALIGTAMSLLVSGCTDRSVSGPVDRPSFNFTNGPEHPGPIVFRTSEGEYRVSYSDPAKGLTAIHGGDVEEDLAAVCAFQQGLHDRLRRRAVVGDERADLAAGPARPDHAPCSKLAVAQQRATDMS